MQPASRTALSPNTEKIHYLVANHVPGPDAANSALSQFVGVL